jgi:uncharacterized damage-inducible protein DinB
MVFKATPDDKLEWRPAAVDGADATNILEIARHCIAADGYFTFMFTESKVPAHEEGAADWFSSASFAGEGPAAGVSNKAGLIKALEHEAAKTDAVIGAVTPEAWAEMVEAPWMTATRAEFLGLLAGHWSYHAGQVAYIQRLYGDNSFG